MPNELIKTLLNFTEFQISVRIGPSPIRTSFPSPSPGLLIMMSPLFAKRKARNEIESRFRMKVGIVEPSNR